MALALLVLLLLLPGVPVPSTTAEVVLEGRGRQVYVEPADEAGYKTYIILIAPRHDIDIDDDDALRAWHESYLPSTTTSIGERRLLCSYRTVFDGFAARLTDDELKVVAAKPGFVRSFPDLVYHLQTTRTPGFLGLPNRMGEHPDNWHGAGGRGMIIGVVDGGIDDSHPSLHDDGFDNIAPPERWKGTCDYATRCNRKLMGAKNFFEPEHPPVDVKSGHGTHVATTAAGNFVTGVSINGNAVGNASGVAPYAHLAIYKACDDDRGCPSRLLMRAIDEAVKDGVDVISLSVGGAAVETFDHNAIAIASFGARQKGVPVVAAAGNAGPTPSSVMNVAPWLITVGAGTVDRSFPAGVLFRDLQKPEVLGESLVHRQVLGPHRGKWIEPVYRTDDFHAACVYTVKS